MKVKVDSPAIVAESLRGLSGIYQITSPSGRIYIGQAQCVHTRWAHHRNTGKARHSNRILDASFKKYGVDSHIFEVVEATPVENLDEREQVWIDAAFSSGARVMNLSPTAGSNRGHKFTEEQKQRCSEAQKRAKGAREVRSDISERFKALWSNPEFKLRQSEKIRDRFKDAEFAKKHAERISQSWARLSEKEKSDRIEAVKMGMAKPESKLKRSESRKKLSENEGYRTKLSEGAKKAWSKQDVKARMKASMKERSARPEYKAQDSLKRFSSPLTMDGVPFPKLLRALQSIDAFRPEDYMTIDQCRELRDCLRKSGAAEITFRKKKIRLVCV